MSRFLKHEPCPACGSRDNLGRWQDGSAYCFGCHYRESASSRVNPSNVSETITKEYADPPDDTGFTFSERSLEWLSKYNLTMQELYERRVRFSPQRQQLVFLFDNNIWQARNFAEGSKSRYFTQGAINEHLPIYRSIRGTSDVPRTCVLVEDCISAIKIARQVDCMPLLGSNISHSKLTRLKHFYENLIFWLDADKYKEAQKLAARAKMLGLSTKVVYTAPDPKEYNDSQIAMHLGT